MTKNGKDTISLSDIEERKKTLESEGLQMFMLRSKN